MSQYNKLSDIQYAIFQILPFDPHFRLFWSAGIPIVHCTIYNLTSLTHLAHCISLSYTPTNCWVGLLEVDC